MIATAREECGQGISGGISVDRKYLEGVRFYDIKMIRRIRRVYSAYCTWWREIAWMNMWVKSDEALHRSLSPDPGMKIIVAVMR